ncbi:sensor histidine kinase [Paraflavitalea soli]|uniref:Oxygen sensor histidine kinase NreB n=1 Tax=Paraflavitalea soli TaxID=2315862 RepID=A0A3B7MWV9_9BACT|nr:sensor histidine kinase [Paraflavitalea soli]AXY77953.1 sensor histidine kinase [Paraflavitalea soli]
MPVNDIINVLLAAALFVISAAGSIVFLVKYIRRSRKSYTHNQQLAGSEMEAQLLKTQLELQEQTLQHISQEIHDNIGQALTFVKLNINTIDLYKMEETQNKLAESKALISKAIQDLRNVAKTINTDFIKEAGLAACIEYQLHFLEKTGLYTTRFHMSESWCKGLPETELVLFRVVQELLNNIVKHAEATAIEVKLECFSGKLLITVGDNGKGFIPSAQVLTDGEKGLGLGNMNRRIAIVQGRILIDSTPGTGTTVMIEAPQKSYNSHNPANKSSDIYNFSPA